MGIRSVLPGGGVESYSLKWIQQTLEPDSVKLGFSAIAVVVEAAWGIFNVLFFAVLVLWALDFLSGVVKVYRCPGLEHSWEKAADGFLKLILYVVVTATCAMAGIIVYETVGWDPSEYFLAGAYSVIAYMEIESIATNINAAWPGLSRALGRVLRHRR